MIKRCGGYAWLGLGIYVLAYDYWAIRTSRETLSEAYGRSMAHPIYRLPTLLISTTVLKHLMAPRLLPQTDWLGYIANRWRMGCDMTDGMAQ